MVVGCRSQMAGNCRTKPRKATLGRLLVIGGMDKNKGATTIESYDPRIDQWSVAYHMSGRRLQFGIAVMGEKYVFVLILYVQKVSDFLTAVKCQTLFLDSSLWAEETA